MNNFQQLEEEELENSRGPSLDVYDNVLSSLNGFRFVGNVFDHFIPKVFRFFVTIMGGDNGPDKIKVSKKLGEKSERGEGEAPRYPNLR